jgi:hypothetical protein
MTGQFRAVFADAGQNDANQAACCNCPCNSATLRPNSARCRALERGRAGSDGCPSTAARLERHRGIFDRRPEVAECSFGTIERRKYGTHYLMRGLEKVRSDLSLTKLAHNFSRVLTLSKAMSSKRR